MSPQKSINYKETRVHYYLVEDKTREKVCKIFQCSRTRLMRNNYSVIKSKFYLVFFIFFDIFILN